jgi:hypothetical protein
MRTPFIHPICLLLGHDFDRNYVCAVCGKVAKRN